MFRGLPSCSSTSALLNSKSMLSKGPSKAPFLSFFSLSLIMVEILDVLDGREFKEGVAEDLLRDEEGLDEVVVEGLNMRGMVKWLGTPFETKSSFDICFLRIEE